MSFKIVVISIISGIILLGITGIIFYLQSCSPKQNWEPLIKDDKSLNDVLIEICKKYNQPAIGAALILGNNILCKASVGNLVFGENQHINIASRFHIGSTTKSFTALLIEILVREGKLKYDLTLKEALPDISMSEKYFNVTVSDLLLNRAGIIAFQEIKNEDPIIVKKIWNEIPSQYSDPTLQRKEMAKIVLNLEPIYEPGKKVVYSNVGWAIAGLIAEVATNQSYEELITKKIFEPLGMSFYKIGGWPASSVEPDQPRGHYNNDGKIIAQSLEDEYLFPAWMNPSGGIHCSIMDYALYARENLLGLQGKGKLLSKDGYENIHKIHIEADLKEMYNYMVLDGKITLGYGWMVIPEGGGFLSAADGSGGTFFARIIVFPGLNVAFVGFTNCGDGSSALDEVIKKISGLDWKS